MENNPFHPSESGDNKSSNKDKKSSDFGFAAYRPAEYTPAPQPERRVQASPAIEGIISWRDDRRDEELHRKPADDAEKTNSESDDDDSEEGDDKKSKSTKTQAQPLPPIRHTPIIPVAEAQPTHPEEDAETDEDEEAGTTATPPVADHRPFAFPQSEYMSRPAETSEEDDDDGLNPADDSHVPRTTITPRAVSSTPAEYVPVASAAPHAAESGVPASYAVESAANDDDNDTNYYTPAPAMGPAQGPAPAAANLYYAPAASSQEDDDDPYVTPAPQPVAAGGGAQPPVLPVTQHMAFNQQPPNPNYAYANQYMHPGGPMANQYNAAPSAANMAPPAPIMPIEHPHYANNRDPRLAPVAATLGLGLLAEHIGRKRGDKKVEKRVNERTDKLLDKQSEQYTATQRRFEDQQRAYANEQDRQASEFQRMRQNQVQERFGAPVAPTELYASQQSIESAPNAGPGYGPVVRAEAPAPMVYNQQNHLSVEARPQVPAAAQEQAAREEAEQAVALNAHEHIKSSNWHNIVVDDQGREIVGKINYGEGFRGEQRHNLMPKIADDSQSDSGGQSQQQAAQGQFAGPGYPGALPSGMTNPTLPQGQLTHADAQHQLEASNKQQATNMTNPWFWIMLLLIIAAFFTATLV